MWKLRNVPYANEDEITSFITEIKKSISDKNLPLFTKVVVDRILIKYQTYCF
jgi:hypothetical protein